MFDFVKLETLDKALQAKLLDNPLLNFVTEINLKTGEIMGDKQTAIFWDIKFVLYPNGRTLISGSLHKLCNNNLGIILNGEATNHDLFTYQKLRCTIGLMKKLFDINPCKLNIQNLEFGFNVMPILNVAKIIDAAVYFKIKPFNQMRGTCGRPIDGIDCYLDEYGIKIYNKTLQYGLTDNILRFEKKVTRMRNEFSTPLTLSCLLNRLLWRHCFTSILEALNEIIFTEPIEKVLTQTERKIHDRCGNPRYWASLSKETKYYNKTKFNNIIEANGTYKIKTKLKQLFAEQLNEMLTEPVENAKAAK